MKGKSKGKGLVRHRISARVLPAFYNRFCAAMKILGMTQQDLILQALETEFSSVESTETVSTLNECECGVDDKKREVA